VLAEGLHRSDTSSFGPADRVTLARAVLVGVVTALVVDTTDPRPDPVMAITVLAAAALAVNAVDGLVARRTHATSTFGARFAIEVDAVLVLVLSAFVATFLGGWVLAIGLLRYAFVVAGRLLPWLRAPLPPSMIRRIVTAAPGVVLTAVVADVTVGVLPRPVAVVLAALALVALTGSLAHDVRWLHRHRVATPARAVAAESPTGGTRRFRRIAGWVVTGLAGLLVLIALVAPNRLSQLTLDAFARIPVEGLMGAALMLVLPTRTRRPAAILIGAGLGLLTIVKFLDMGFYEVFDRPFHPVFDWTFFGPAIDFLETSVGNTGAVLAVIGVVVLVLALLVLMTLAVLRLTRIAVGHRTTTTRTIATLGVVWLVCALSGIALTPQQPVAARSAADHVYDEVQQVRQGLGDGDAFAAQTAVDHFRYTPGNKLLTALHGKDVLFVFVESYGRVAIENSDSAPKIDPILDAGTEQLDAAGFNSRSAFLTSPTYGGGSWLAHATFQTGLWIDNQQRYGQLNTLDHTTLSTAFNRAGWRTVGDVPRNTMDWPEGAFYHYDKVYDARNLGYRGPKFAYATVPDQYTLQHFEHTERDTNSGPVMAEIDLISSHTPYTPLPQFIDWNQIGDGTIYKPMPKAGPQPSEVWPDPTKVHAAYTKSIAYSLKSVISYVQTYGDDDLVLVFLGDHQPQPIIASQEGTRDVPITILARDPAVLDSISGWGWQKGLNPDPNAPVWPMDTFRDKFLTAYGPQNQPTHKASPRR
jgi:phosphatidylglycerophosphate synthase